MDAFKQREPITKISKEHMILDLMPLAVFFCVWNKQHKPMSQSAGTAAAWSFSVLDSEVLFLLVWCVCVCVCVCAHVCVCTCACARKSVSVWRFGGDRDWEEISLCFSLFEFAGLCLLIYLFLEATFYLGQYVIPVQQLIFTQYGK